MTEPSYTVLGEEVTLPVEIRDAESHFGQFLVPSGVVADLISPTGLTPIEVFPGRAICALAGVRYLDGDLGAYHELAVAFLVRPPGSGTDLADDAAARVPNGAPGGSGGGGVGAVLTAAQTLAASVVRSAHQISDVAAGRIGAHIHRLPVNQEFTCAAGRQIWGFPKIVRTIDFDVRGGHTIVALRDADDEAAPPEVELEFAPGIPLGAGAAGALGGGVAIDASSYLDGVLRQTAWTMGGSGIRMRPGGVRVRLGRGEIADELRRLGFPRRALSCGTIGAFRCTFGAAQVIATGSGADIAASESDSGTAARR